MLLTPLQEAQKGSVTAQSQLPPLTHLQHIKVRRAQPTHSLRCALSPPGELPSGSWTHLTTTPTPPQSHLAAWELHKAKLNT